MSDPYPTAAEAIAHIRRADSRWQAALARFGSYGTRLRELSEAARAEQRALMFAEVCQVSWRPHQDSGDIRLEIELEAGHRIGPENLWGTFDDALAHLGRALVGDGWADAAAAFGEIAAAASDLADAIDADQQVEQTG